jgi:hypothetical protein
MPMWCGTYADVVRHLCRCGAALMPMWCGTYADTMLRFILQLYTLFLFTLHDAWESADLGNI